MAIIVLWSVLGIVSSLEMRLESTFSPSQTGWGAMLFMQLSFTTVCAALTPAILWWARRFPVDKRPYWPSVLAHLFGAAAFTVVAKSIWSAWMYAHEGKFLSWNKLFWNIVYSADYCFVLYCMVVLVSCVVVYYRRYQHGVLNAARLNGELAQAQLRWLKGRLHPHFLFNALHTISALIHEDPDAADRMIARLSELLRLSLRDSSLQEVPLEQELEYLDVYLDIERTRFADNLHVIFDIADDTQDALVPSLVLQPIVENAIRHGLGGISGVGVIKITAVHEGSKLLLTVADNGKGICNPPLESVREGVGLSSVRGRLETLYGPAQSLVLHSAQGEGVEARIVIPFRSCVPTVAEVIHEEIARVGDR